MQSFTRRLVSGLLAPVAIGLAGLAVGAPAAAGNAPALAAEALLLAAEDQRFEAQVRGDVAAVDQALADELIYTHAVGRVQTKAQYLAALASGRVPYRSIVAKDRMAKVSGDLGVIRGMLDMEVGERRLSSSYLAAYVERGGRWRLLYWQTSPVPQQDGGESAPK